MKDEDEELLAELMLRWDELREQGQDVSSIELCQACPHLSDELERRIGVLRAFDWLDRPIEVSDTDDDDFETATHPQRTLAGRYRLDDLIAEGGFAQVWRAYDLELYRDVAVKVPKPSRLDSEDAFMAEARRVARLKHPGIVAVHDVGRENGICFIVSELIEGGNLGDHIKRLPLSVQQATQWAAEIAEALEYAHCNGVIHRDIKPANILIDHHGRALLADFGIAQSATKTGRFAPSIGTLRYMAPEQLVGKEVDARSDVYSLGVVLYEMLTGKLPYSSTEPTVLRQEIVAGAKLGSENISTELRRICLKALQLDPKDRYQSAKSLAVELSHRVQHKRGRGFILSLLLLPLALGVGAFALWRPQPADPQAKLPVASLDGQSVTPLEQINERSAVESWKTTEQPTGYADAIELGDKWFDRHQFGRAIQHYTTAIGFDDTNAQAYFKRGRCHFNAEAFRDSLIDFKRANELEPTNPQFLERVANANFHLRQFDEAVAAMEKAIKLNPPEVELLKESLAIMLSNRAFAHSQEKNFADAIADLNMALKLDPDGQHFHRQRAGCYYNSKNFEKALADFDEAIRRDPQISSYYLNRGYCLQALGRSDEAITDFEKAEELGRK